MSQKHHELAAKEPLENDKEESKAQLLFQSQELFEWLLINFVFCSSINKFNNFDDI